MPAHPRTKRRISVKRRKSKQDGIVIIAASDRLASRPMEQRRSFMSDPTRAFRPSPGSRSSPWRRRTAIAAMTANTIDRSIDPLMLLVTVTQNRHYLIRRPGTLGDVLAAGQVSPPLRRRRQHRPPAGRPAPTYRCSGRQPPSCHLAQTAGDHEVVWRGRPPIRHARPRLRRRPLRNRRRPHRDDRLSPSSLRRPYERFR